MTIFPDFVIERLATLVSFTDLRTISVLCHETKIQVVENAFVLCRWKHHLNASIVGANIKGYLKSVIKSGAQICTELTAADLQIAPMRTMAARRATWQFLASQMLIYEHAVLAWVSNLPQGPYAQYPSIHECCLFLSDHFDVHVVCSAFKKQHSAIAALTFAWILYKRLKRGRRLSAQEKLLLTKYVEQYGVLSCHFTYSTFGEQTSRGSRGKDVVMFQTCLMHQLLNMELWGHLSSQKNLFESFEYYATMVHPLGVEKARICVNTVQ